MEANNQMMKGDRVEARTARERDAIALRSVEISQIRLLARKRPDEFRRIAMELFDLMVKM